MATSVRTARVLITCPQMQRTIDRYRVRFHEADIEIVLPDVVQQLNEEQLIPIIGEYDGMIAGDDYLTERVLQHAKKMKIISKWGVGIDNVDVEAASRIGIKVTNTPGAFGGEVADVTIGYLILLARKLHLTDRIVRDGCWNKIQGTTLAEKTLGVVGLGAIGNRVVRRALAMEMKVLGFDVLPQAVSAAEDLGATGSPLGDLLRNSDFIALCCPLTAENHHMVNTTTIATMKPGVAIVNAARGPLIDEAALAVALDSGHVSGAALEVFEIEPLPLDSPLRGFEQVILGAHNSSNTIEGTLRVNELAIANLFAGLNRGVS